jgi:putative transferase (TIGR04331 family)
MTDAAYFLITTANENSWNTGEKILALGEWCNLYHRKEQWVKLNPTVVPYHWDNRDQLYQDYQWLRDLHERQMKLLADSLNRFHGTQHSVRYWRILVGPWLLYFTQMLFDRYQMIQKAAKDYRIQETWVLDFPLEKMIPRNMDEFRAAYFSDNWNHVLYGQILENWTQVPCKRKPLPAGEDIAFVQKPVSHAAASMKMKIRNLVSKVSQFFSKHNPVFLMISYLPVPQELLLQIKMGQFPALNSVVAPPMVQPDLEIRKKFRLPVEGLKGFEQCLRSLIPDHIPTLYLEGYQQLADSVKPLPWSRKPRVMMTGSNYNADDVFKIWAAQWVENGAHLVIGQHGGNMGTALWTSTEDHEIAISDRYLTWGWSDGNPKHYPTVVLKQVGRQEQPWKRDGKLLLVSSVLPRYSYVMGAFSVAAGQTEANLQDQYEFMRALPTEIFDQTVVRLFNPDWEWSQMARWRDLFPTAHIDSGKAPIAPLVAQARIYVATYNATTFLESLSLNIPTIMFWRPDHWEVRPQAEPYFQRLREVGIYHDSPKEAASQVAQIWGSVEQWWSSQEVQSARKYFCDRYARMDENALGIVKEALATVGPIK